MRGLLALIRREARDARTLGAFAAVAVAGLAFGAEEIWLGYASGEVTATVVVPVLVALAGVALASDLLAADIASRRTETWALLPVRPLTLWAAKALFLVLSLLAFLAWVVLVEILIHVLAAGPGAGGRLIEHGSVGLAHCGPALGLAGIVMFFSTILERGIAAALAGVILAGGGAWALFALDPAIANPASGSGAMGVAGLVVALAFFAGSAHAFVGGRPHLGGRFRPVVLGSGAAVLVLLLAAAVWLQLAPDALGATPEGRKSAGTTALDPGD